MLIKLRRGKKAQSLVIVALSATALFGIIALGLDAGRLYFQRRDVQNAADAGALAGAQELLPSSGTVGVNSTMVANAGCQASIYALKNLLDVPRDACGSPNYTPGTVGGGITEPAQNIAATVQVWTPSRGSSNEIHVRVTYNVPLTFAALLGFTNSAVVADAYAHGGFYNNQYAVFGFQAGPGGGNTVNFDQVGYAQIDDGNNGSDICQPSMQGRIVSNSKWHAPNPHPGWLNINGDFSHLSASDTHAVRLYWYQTVNPVPVQEPAPNYEATYSPSLALASGKSGNTVHIHAGLHTSTINIPGEAGGGANDTYIFDNGIYVFQNASLNITGGTVSNTVNGQALTTLGTYSNLPAAADGTNGVEFIFDGNGGFSASTSGNTSPSVFFVAPDITPSGVTNHIAFYILSTDTNTTPWSETIDGTKSTYGNYPFQVWGTVFDDEPFATGVIQAVSTSTYAVEGEFISARVDLDGGNMANEPTITPSTPGPGPVGTPTCTGGYVSNPAGLLVQYSVPYSPHFRGYAYLVK
ncbi:MAG TPA: pilus assembly protein TadG-related protein [Candidatus Acidoferrum sp.]|nr:pilus assembly protein TadG-related protein [Candidatus Acidoferrum sp.]